MTVTTTLVPTTTTTKTTPTTRRNLLFSATAAATILSTTETMTTPAARAAAVTPPATVFVAGATGETGRRTVAALVDAGFRVRAGARNRAKAEEMLSSLLQDKNENKIITVVDLDLETMGVDELSEAIGDEASAVVCCVGSRPSSPLDRKTAAAVDRDGTINLVNAAVRLQNEKKNIQRFVLLSSILTNGKAAGQGLNPAYLFLEVASGNVLTAKLDAERALRTSGIDWSVVRPGGLSSKSPEELGAGGVFLSAEDTIFGQKEIAIAAADGDGGGKSVVEIGSVVSRDAVADVLVAAVRAPRAAKVVEVVASRGVPTSLGAEELDRAFEAV